MIMESFYRPYKGLKHDKKQNDNNEKACFYRPYKGLKHHCVILCLINHYLVFLSSL